MDSSFLEPAQSVAGVHILGGNGAAIYMMKSKPAPKPTPKKFAPKTPSRAVRNFVNSHKPK